MFFCSSWKIWFIIFSRIRPFSGYPPSLSPWGLKDKSPNLHKKAKPWRILVSVPKWRHRENGLLTTPKRVVGVEFVYSIKTTRRFNSHAKYIVRFDKNYVIVYSSRVGQIFTIPCNLIFKRSVDLVWLWCLGCAILPFFSRAHTDVAPADTWYRWGGFSLMWNHLVPVQGKRREE